MAHPLLFGLAAGFRTDNDQKEHEVALTARAGSIRATGLAALLAVLWTTADARGLRLVAEINEPFVLLGQFCPAGKVTIRAVSQYNPGSTLHEVCIEDECLGVFPAARVAFETEDERDILRFARDAAGTLVLLGYTLHHKGRTEFHRFGGRFPNHGFGDAFPLTPPGTMSPHGTRRHPRAPRRRRFRRRPRRGAGPGPPGRCHGGRDRR